MVQQAFHGEKTSPMVSTVIATKARPKLVLRAVATVLQQTFSDLELIVVVDGPDAETEAGLSLIRDSRLRVIVNSMNVGCAASRMVGVNAAKGEWVAFLDDDDEWLPKKLEHQIEEMQRTTALERSRLIVTCAMHIVSPFGDSVRPKRIYDNGQAFDVWLFDRTGLRNGAVFQASSVLVSAELARTLRFRPEAAHEDWDFALRAKAEKDAKIITVPKPLVRHYRDDLTPRMTNDHKIAESLDWLDNLGGAVSRRGYSAFCLNVIASHAADRGKVRWFLPLLVRAFKRGAPTARQLAGFIGLWLMRKRMRRLILGFLLDRRRTGDVALTETMRMSTK